MEAKITELKAFIEDIKPGFRILESEYGKVPLPLILDLGLTQTDNYQGKISEFRRKKSAFNNHLEKDGFSFISFQSDRSFSLNQLTCREPGCPPIETAIALAEQPPKQYKIHKAIAEIQQSDIYQLKAK